MKNPEEHTKIIFVILSLFVFVVGFTMGTTSAREETEQKTIMMCMEKPKDCIIKYNFYQLENEK